MKNGLKAGRGDGETRGKGETVRPRETVIRKHTDLEVYQRGFSAAMSVFEHTRSFPRDERYSLTDQIRRSSRSVCANLAEAWRKRRYEAAFVSKLTDSEAEAAETQVWLQFAVQCRCLSREIAAPIYSEYDDILGMLVNMRSNPKPWLLV
jgi:four helix bundle protein